MKRRIPLRSLALTAALLSASPASAQQADGGQPVSFRPPMEVTGLQLVNQQVTPEAGASLRYQAPGKVDFIDVYVYPPVVEGGCERACDSIAANTEADGFTSMIPEMVRRGFFDSLRVEADERVDVASGGQTLHGRHLRLRGGRGARPVSSRFYLFPAGSLLVKVRATYPPSAHMDSVVDRFARGFVSTALQRTLACTGGEPQADGIEMSVELASPLPEVRTRVVAALQKLGYELEPGPPDANQWRTLPRRGWPPGDWGSLASFPHPGVAVWARVGPKGDKTELRVGARPICGVPQKREVESTAALVAAMQVMTEFPEMKKN